jgi:hypothetical protein
VVELVVVIFVWIGRLFALEVESCLRRQRVGGSRRLIWEWRRGMVAGLRAGGRRLLPRKMRGLGWDSAWRLCSICVRVLGGVRSSTSEQVVGGVVSRELRWPLPWLSSQVRLH